MKLLSFEHAGKASFGVLRGDAVLDLAPYASKVGHTLQQAIEKDASFEFQVGGIVADSR